jgi:phage protein U
MWGKFGEVTFKLLKTPEALNRSSRAKFARISLFGEKEKLHFTGLEPETVELSVKFHSSFCNPLEEVETLRKYLQSGESHILIVGDYVKGKFVIEGLREESGRTDKRGNPLQILVNLTLKEDVSDAQNQP